MKTLIQTLLFLLMLSTICFAQWISTESDSLIQQVTSQVNLDSLTYYLRVLTGEDSVTIGGNRYLIRSRNAYNSGNNLAADFIYQTLRQDYLHLTIIIVFRGEMFTRNKPVLSSPIRNS